MPRKSAKKAAPPLDPQKWSPEKVANFQSAFYDFLSHVHVNSKERGRICLGDEVYRAQKRAADGIFEGLAHDIHDFKILKSRQLGISTFCRALTLFWAGVHDGLKGYMVFDTDPHKEEARLELISMLENLPPRFDFPRIKRANRYLLELENGTTINFAAAGVKQSKSSGVLGRSSGINFVHASEMCSWDNVEGLESFKNALAEDFPDRLYIWESTARGFNQWHDMWTEALESPNHEKCIFIGWWAKDNQRIPTSHPDFARYGVQPPSEKELEKIKLVREKYGWEITPEQLAWVRRKMDPAAKPSGDAPPEFEGDVLRMQEQPWTDEDAFQMTGAVFFDPQRLAEMATRMVRRDFKTYWYSPGVEFTDCQVLPAHNARSVQLKVWEEPVEGGVYVVAADPAFGANEKNDRSACQVLRCYADGLDQVAEYAWPLINTRQFGWVIASLLGWYGMEKNEIHHILEINGPGEAVWNEIKSLKQQIATGYQPQALEEKGLKNIFQNVKNYIYTRSDSMSPGFNYHFKTQSQLKISIMERLRDFTSNNMLIVRSQDTLEEMRSVTREGDSIASQGTKKDDRVLALALGVRCWEERIRRHLMTRQMTRANEEIKQRLTIQDQVQMFNQNHLTSFFAVKAGQRRRAAGIARKVQWRGRL